ncbi:MAG: hypothetical protein WCW77_02535 [Patescibacteria group bacterium]|jgi:hypothetical protein
MSESNKLNNASRKLEKPSIKETKIQKILESREKTFLPELPREKPKEINPTETGPVKSRPKIAPGNGLADISNLQKAKKAKQKEIEKIMEENVEEIYMSLPPDKQIRFRAEGEKAAHEINDLIDRGRATLKKVIELIKKWLSAVPGVNRYFLEQEAKIKADKIMEMKDN